VAVCRYCTTIPPDEVFNCGLLLTNEGPWDKSRKVKADYHHIFGGWGIDSVSIGGGISTSPKWRTDEMTIDTQNNGEFLEVTQEEADWRPN
jgi:hypothetical protein